MTETPVVSIIVVTFGTGPVVLEALDAVACDTSVDHEVLVVDCLPVDPTTRTIPLLADRADIWIVAVDDNLGFASGNEYGTQHASSEYLCFLNRDDTGGRLVERIDRCPGPNSRIGGRRRERHVGRS